MAPWTLADELALAPPNVARGALLCAQAVAYPRLDIEETLARLADLALAAQSRVPRTDPPLQRGLLLADYLFKEAGFRGDQDTYSDPRSSFLNDVLARKLGLPITLSILYVDIAGRLEIPAYGVGLPGHFIVGLDDGRERWYLDPFHGGERLSVDDCALLVESTTGYGGPFQSAWLEPLPAADILARLLNNLRVGYVRREQWPQAIAVIEQLRLIQPELPEHLRDLGLIHYHGRTPHLAAHYLEAYLQMLPDAPDAEAIRKGIAGVLDEWVRLN
jgi:regulator of sirC expression with transglutaminase-like and TPR domain